MQNTKLLILIFFLSIISSKTSVEKNKTIEEKQNIILIMADDMRFSDLGFMSSSIKTQNIDLMANNGMVFNQFYNAVRCYNKNEMYGLKRIMFCY